ncbi:MAG: SO2930 family diheme c-type cytochrome, partial [Acidobacteriota bacterium]
RVFLGEPFPETLSSWRLFERGGALLRPNVGVVPYDLNSALFSDNAAKYRFVWMPAGEAASYDEEESFSFPVGTIFSKTFAFPSVDESGNGEHLIETRLLVRANKGWVALPYIWNNAQTEAVLTVAGGVEDVTVKDATGAAQNIRYGIPNTNECAQCHERSKTLLPIGPKARHLNRDFVYADGRENQLTHWTKIGYLRGAPAVELSPRAAVWNDPASGTVEARARAYLDVNCAHCHQSGGSAGYTGFLLGWKVQDQRRLGYCKNPNSAGFSGNLAFDVVPGKPDESILLYRMLSTRPKEMMPEIGRSLAHHEGAVLVREWLAALKGDCEPDEK